MSKYIAIMQEPLLLPYCIEIEADNTSQAVSMVNSKRESLSLSYCYFIADLENQTIYRTAEVNGSLRVVSDAFEKLGIATEFQTEESNSAV